ncbi:dihydrodipicolinate synthase family protein [Limnoglobus roseus]|uniref:N-acetylneuraminate lyase n=1 Tax=Limnoglobus roseus TaxID=2598579 RepID=A0A5C1AD07_9BACT|nr:dihydrodipicolinate synthase family protein [Limnoglobus roseus]QEL17181.1 N-acetylneuraminate lyase [Limnoglobus roseus]
MSSPFTGLIAAPFTAFDARGAVNRAAIVEQAAVLRESNVRGAFVCGTTGEGLSLTTAERQTVAEEWVRVAGDKLKVIVHAGHASVAEAANLTAHAAAIGAAAVAVTAPFYFRPGSVTELATFLAEVAAAAPKLPFYYYDIPSTTGVNLPAADVLRRAAKVIPNLAGVKFSNPDLLTLQECVQLDGGRFDVLFGVDEYLLAAVSLGATGAVGSTYNYAAPVYHRMLAALREGDLEAACRHQYGSAQLVRALIDFGGLRAGKAIMKMLGVDCGPVRSPLRPMTDDEEVALYERLRPLDIFARPLRRP